MRLQLETNIAANIAGTAGTGSTGIGGVQGTKAGSSAASAGDGAGNNFGNPLDSTSISGASSLLNRLSADRAGRIQALTSAVQGGTYQIPTAAISSALVTEALL